MSKYFPSILVVGLVLLVLAAFSAICAAQTVPQGPAVAPAPVVPPRPAVKPLVDMIPKPTDAWLSRYANLPMNTVQLYFNLFALHYKTQLQQEEIKQLKERVAVLEKMIAPKDANTAELCKPGDVTPLTGKPTPGGDPVMVPDSAAVECAAEPNATKE